MGKTSSISVGELKRRLSEVVARASYAGETFVITRRGKPVAELSPRRNGGKHKHLAEMRGWLDGDDPFFRYVERARSEGRRRGLRVDRRPPL